MNFINKQTGEQLSEQAIAELWKEGKISSLPYTFGDRNILSQQIHFYMQLANGYKVMLDRSNQVRHFSKKKLLNPKTNQTQRARCLYDIARFDMIPHSMIGFFGNGKLPKELEDWKPTFGYKWYFEAIQEVKVSDIQGNLYWHFEADKFFNDYHDSLEAPSVKDIEMRIVDNDSLWISRGKNTDVFKFEELEDFWDKKSKVPNTLAHIMIDLSNDHEVKLKQNCETHKTFGKGTVDQSSKQISKLANAFDKLIETRDQTQTATKRWFKVAPHRDKAWTPRFKFKSSRSEEDRKLIADVLKKNQTANKLAEEMDKTVYESKWKSVEDKESLSFEVKSEKALGLEDWKNEKEMNFSD
tara:strand:+ start:1938 stop:3002 length:1065 start_codon:yes stop_codon:yes gene_type:complete